jgi:hypothetical protein
MIAQVKRSMWAMLLTFIMLGAALSSSAYATSGGYGNGGDNKDHNGQKDTNCYSKDSEMNHYGNKNVDMGSIYGGSNQYGQHNDCNNYKVAIASVTVKPATCDSGAKLVYGPIVGATYSGTPNGTTGPASYDVTATANAGYQFNNKTSTLPFKGMLSGPLTGEECIPTPVLKTATASVNKLPATCTAGEQLSFSNVSNAVASGTANGTTGPANFDVTFTANQGAEFDNKGTTVVNFTGTLAGPLNDTSCSGGSGSTQGSVTPKAPSTPTVMKTISLLPETSGDTSTAVVAGGGLLTTLLGFAGARRLFGRSL